MSVYLVRLPRDGAAPAALVGIYVAESVAALERQVDAACAAHLCEYANVPHGSMYVAEADSEGEGLYAGGVDRASAGDQLSEDWRELFFGAERPEWRTFASPVWGSPVDRHDALVTARRALALS